MREIRGAGIVVVRHVPGVYNPADLFTKISSRQVFEQHRKYVLNLPGDTGVEHAQRIRIGERGASCSSQRDGMSDT